MPVAARGYQIDLGREEINVIRTLANGLVESGESPILVWGNRPDWIMELRTAGLKAYGAWNEELHWPFYFVSRESGVSLKTKSIQLFLYFGDHDFAFELTRIVRRDGYIVFDPKQNPNLECDLRFFGWKRRFDFHEYRVYQNQNGRLKKAA